MVIDAHAHACGELGTLDGILGYLQKNNLDKIVLCPGEQNSSKNYPVPMMSSILPISGVAYGFNRIIRQVVKRSGVYKSIHEQNESIASMARSYPNQIMQAYWCNPLEQDCLERMDAFYQNHPFCMVKLHQCWHNFDLRNSIVSRVLHWAQAYRLPVFIHLLSDEQSHAFHTLANAYPDCPLILGHMIGFEAIAPNLKYDNVYFDISAPFMIPFRYLQKAVQLWGGSRLLLGSDTPYGNQNIQKNKQRIERLGIGQEARNAILGENFEYLLSLRRHP